MPRLGLGAPHVMAYWWKSPSRARWAASTSSRGGGKLGMPWARVMPPGWGPPRGLARITRSVNPCTRFEIPVIGAPSRQEDVMLDGVHRHALRLEPGHPPIEPF